MGCLVCEEKKTLGEKHAEVPNIINRTKRLSVPFEHDFYAQIHGP